MVRAFVTGTGESAVSACRVASMRVVGRRLAEGEVKEKAGRSVNVGLQPYVFL